MHYPETQGHQGIDGPSGEAGKDELEEVLHVKVLDGILKNRSYLTAARLARKTLKRPRTIGFLGCHALPSIL
jgi:hypothetical protein